MAAKKEKNKTEDLKAKTTDELQKALLDSRKEQFNLRFQRTGGQLADFSQLRKIRRKIAQIKTFLNQKDETKAAKKAKPAAKKTTKSKKAA